MVSASMNSDEMKRNDMSENEDDDEDDDSEDSDGRLYQCSMNKSKKETKTVYTIYITN